MEELVGFIVLAIKYLFGFIVLVIKYGFEFIGLAIKYWYITLPLAGIWGVIYSVTKARKEKKQREEEENARRQRHTKKQHGYCNEMIALGEQSLVLFKSIPNLLRCAEGYLNQAELQFAYGAFAPFWDCIENAAKVLNRSKECVRQIKNNVRRHGSLIAKYEGMLPSFLLTHESVSKLGMATTTAKRMHAIVWKAQCNFQFAMIYEQRKTNQILVAGFTNLAQALKNMTWQLTASIDKLVESVDEMNSTLSKVESYVWTISEAVSQNSMRVEKVLEKLDGIRRGNE